MTNSILFRKSVANSGVKYKHLAQLIGITPYGLQRKIDNQSEFKASEIYKLSDVLNLSDVDRNAIFFSQKSDF